ncbi:MAG: ABC transporter ATP-binding protein [Candidatus Pacearchaeota archaeon]
MKKQGPKGEKIDFKHNFKVFWDLIKEYKWPLIGLIAIVTIVEALSLAEKYLFKIVVDKGGAFAAGEITKSAFVDVLLIVGAVFVASTILISVGWWIQVHIINRVDSKIMLKVKKKFFNHVLRLSSRFHSTHSSGKMVSRIDRGTNATERMTDLIVLSFAPIIVKIIIISIAFSYFSWPAAVAVFVTGALFFFYSYNIINKAQVAEIDENKKKDREKGIISDSMANIESIKYYGKESYIVSKFKNMANFVRNAYIAHMDYYRGLNAGQKLIIRMGTLFVIFFPLIKFIQGDLTLGTLTFIYTSYGTIIGPIAGIVHGVRQLYSSMADFQELFKYEKVENEIKDKPNAKKLKVTKGQVEFENVDFSYENESVVKNINLDIKPNEKVALVGHSGSGKSTLIKLLYRLYDVQKGSIKIDGQDVRNVKRESLRSELSIVPQEAVLFDDTIYNNIAFSRPSASKEEVWKAIRFAQLDDFVKRLSKKENTIVGERGVKLSGGERQRVSIARAILANKKILVLDEATSSLDSKTENEIQKGLHKLMKNRTTIMIAHRLSTIMNADKIVVLDKGRISGIGKHKELIKRNKIYKELWNLQKGGFIG